MNSTVTTSMIFLGAVSMTAGSYFNGGLVDALTVGGILSVVIGSLWKLATYK